MLKKYDKVSFYLLFAIAAGLLWYFQSLIVENVPFWDDFLGIITPVYDMLSDIPLSEKITALFSQNNEHRIVNDRLFMWFVYLLRGQFDMKFLAMLGFLNLIGIVWIFIRVFRHEKISLIFLLPLVFFLFQAQYYESLQSLMVPFQNFSVIFYALLSFYLLIYGRGGVQHSFAFFFAALSFYTHGNGIFVIMIGAMILMFKASLRPFITWLFFSVLVVISYFYGYMKPDWSTSSSPIERPVESFFYFFEFMGSFGLTFLEISGRLLHSPLKKIFPSLLGIIFFGTFVYFFLKKYPLGFKWGKIRDQVLRLSHSRFDFFIFAAFAFFTMTGLIVALHRTGFPMMSRYTINSSIFVSIVYMFLLRNVNGNYKISCYRFFTGLSLTYLLLGYFVFWDIASFRRKLAIADGVNWQRNKIWMTQYFDSRHIENLKHLLDKPYSEKMYFFPPSALTQVDKIPFEPNIFPAHTHRDGLLLMINEQYDHQLSTDPEEGLYYIFKSKEHLFVIPGFGLKNNLAGFLTSGKYYSGLTKTGFPVHLAPNGTYEIIRLEYRNGVFKKYRTGETVVNTEHGADYPS